MSNNISHNVVDEISVLTFDDGKANVFNPDSVAEFLIRLDEAEKAKSKVLLICGREKFFSAGLDLKVIPNLEKKDFEKFTQDFFTLMARVFMFPKPTVAYLNGHALAGGCVLTCTCDYRIGSSGNYKIGLNEVQIGVPLPSLVSVIAQNAINRDKFAEAYLLAKVYNYEESLKIGFLNNIIGDEDPVSHILTKTNFKDLKLDAYRISKERLYRKQIEFHLDNLMTEVGEAFLPEM